MSYETVDELLEHEIFSAACHLFSHVCEPGQYEHPTKFGVWSADFEDTAGEFEEGCEVSLYELTLTYKAVDSYGQPQRYELGDSAAFTLPGGGGYAVSADYGNVFDDGDPLAILAALVAQNVVDIDSALETIAEDEAYDDQDYMLFKIAQSGAVAA